MIKDLRKYLKNKQRTGEFCEKILGTNELVHKFAGFWGQYHEEMDVIFAALLHEWVVERGFDSYEVQAYKEGLASYEMFFQKCAEEVAKKKLKDEQEGHQVLGMDQVAGDNSVIN